MRTLTKDSRRKFIKAAGSALFLPIFDIFVPRSKADVNVVVGQKPVVAGGSLAHVTSQGTQWFGGSGTTETAPSITCTAGNLLIIAVGWGAGSGASITGVSGNGNSYVIVGASEVHGTTGAMSVYRAYNIAGGATSVQVTWGADPGFGFITVHEVSGASTTAALDQHDYVSPVGQSGGLVTTASITPGTSGQYIFAAVLDEGGGFTCTVGSGYTMPANSNQDPIGASEYKVHTSGATTATFGQTGGNFDDYITFIGSFK